MAEAKILDVKGLVCPMPVIKTKKAVSELKTGEILNVLATDPASKHDIVALISLLGGTVLGISEEEGVITFQIEK